VSLDLRAGAIEPGTAFPPHREASNTVLLGEEELVGAGVGCEERDDIIR
jgi:hypothetical protein